MSAVNVSAAKHSPTGHLDDASGTVASTKLGTHCELLGTSLEGHGASLWTSKARFYGDGDGVGRVPFRRLSALSSVCGQCSKVLRRARSLPLTVSALCTTSTVSGGTRCLTLDLESPVLWRR